jgi:hypothetical protein
MCILNKIVNYCLLPPLLPEDDLPLDDDLEELPELLALLPELLEQLVTLDQIVRGKGLVKPR